MAWMGYFGGGGHEGDTVKVCRVSSCECGSKPGASDGATPACAPAGAGGGVALAPPGIAAGRRTVSLTGLRGERSDVAKIARSQQGSVERGLVGVRKRSGGHWAEARQVGGPGGALLPIPLIPSDPTVPGPFWPKYPVCAAQQVSAADRLAWADPSARLWPNGIVPFAICRDLADRPRYSYMVGLIRQAMQIWTATTEMAVQFVEVIPSRLPQSSRCDSWNVPRGGKPCPSDAAIHPVDGDAPRLPEAAPYFLFWLGIKTGASTQFRTWSGVSDTGISCGMRLTTGFPLLADPIQQAARAATVLTLLVHELGHAIGLGHYWQRSDRDRWVRSATTGGLLLQSAAIPGDEPSTPFDYQSIESFYSGFSYQDIAGNLRSGTVDPPTPSPSAGDASKVQLLYFRQTRPGWGLPRSLDYMSGSLGPPVPWFFVTGEPQPQFTSLVGALGSRLRADGRQRPVPVGSPALASSHEKRLEVASWGSDGSVYLRRLESLADSGAWAPWIHVSAGATSEPSIVVSPGRETVVAYCVGVAGQLEHRTVDLQGRVGEAKPVLVDGAAARARRAVGSPGFVRPALVTTAVGTVELFYCDENARLSVVRVRGTGSLRVPDIITIEPPTAVSLPNGSALVSVVERVFQFTLTPGRHGAQRTARLFEISDASVLEVAIVGLPANILTTPSVGVNAVGQPFLIAADSAGFVRLWEPSTGTHWRCVGGIAAPMTRASVGQLVRDVSRPNPSDGFWLGIRAPETLDSAGTPVLPGGIWVRRVLDCAR